MTIPIIITNYEFLLYLAHVISSECNLSPCVSVTINGNVHFCCWSWNRSFRRERQIPGDCCSFNDTHQLTFVFLVNRSNLTSTINYQSADRDSIRALNPGGEGGPCLVNSKGRWRKFKREAYHLSLCPCSSSSLSTYKNSIYRLTESSRTSSARNGTTMISSACLPVFYVNKTIFPGDPSEGQRYGKTEETFRRCKKIPVVARGSEKMGGDEK